MRITLYKRGNFYRCYNEDSYILAYLLDYKVTMTNRSDMSGFPTNNLNKVLNEFEKNKISYIVYDSAKNGVKKAEYDFDIENNYEEIYEIAYEYVRLRNRIEKIKYKLKENINNKKLVESLDEIEKIL